MIWTDDWVCLVSKEEEGKVEKLPVREGSLHYLPSGPDPYKLYNTG